MPPLVFLENDMAILNNSARSKNIRWVVDDGYIVMGPKLRYRPKSLFLIALSIMAISFVLVPVFGSGILGIEGTVSTFLMLICLVVFLYGIQLHNIVREATKAIEKREKDIEKANNYVKKGKKNGKQN